MPDPPHRAMFRLSMCEFLTVVRQCNGCCRNEVRRRSSEGGRSESRYRTSISRDEYESSSRPGEKDHEKIIWL